MTYVMVGIDSARIFMINEKGLISHYNNSNIHTSYTDLNEMINLYFPYKNDYNTVFVKSGYFKPRLDYKQDISKLFS